MRKFKGFLILFLGVSLLASTACNKDEDDDNNNNNDPTTKTCYVVKMDYGDEYDEITYNSSNQVILQNNFDSNGVATGYSTEFTYSNALLSKMESLDNGQTESKLEIVYAADKIDTVHLYAQLMGGLEKVGFYKYSYSGDNVSSVSMYYEVMGNMVEAGKSEFTYTGDNVSMLKMYEFDVATMGLKLAATMEYTYDDKTNPFIGIGIDNLMGDVMFMSKNNVITETIKDADGIVQNDASLNYTYTYSNNNYPEVSTVTTFDNSETEITTYTYDCE